MQAQAVKKHDSTQADLNYEAFRKLLPEILKSHAGQFALMRDGSIVEYFSTLGDAVKFGKEKFGDHNFSVQEVTSQSANLGFHSYALYHISN